MSERENTQVILDIYAAFGRGDIDYILSRLSDDIIWESRMDAIVPWSGRFDGKAGVQRFFDSIFNSVEVQAFEPQEFIAQGDIVVSTGVFGCRVRATHKTALTRWCFIWRLRDGIIESYEQFHDPAIEEAFRV